MSKVMSWSYSPWALRRAVKGQGSEGRMWRWGWRCLCHETTDTLTNMQGSLDA